ncbi:MAG TPA: hypothetical protein ENK12_04550 [Gammaproteobacteria bacterium]|nr:hypothetical protein [Gammaproteobacteria bacterium]
MNDPTRHPDTELLDRLRAGLLDDQPQAKQRLEDHLRECRRCARLADWQPLAARVTGPGDAARLDAALRRARQQALGRRRRPTRRLLPLALAASLVAAIAVGLYTPQPETDTGPTRVAHSEEAGTPDLYEDLDFYLWLADHRQGGGGQSADTDQHG